MKLLRLTLLMPSELVEKLPPKVSLLFLLQQVLLLFPMLFKFLQLLLNHGLTLLLPLLTTLKPELLQQQLVSPQYQPAILQSGPQLLLAMVSTNHGLSVPSLKPKMPLLVPVLQLL